MNRCALLLRSQSHLWRTAVLTVLVGISLGHAVNAQERIRPFPANAIRGTMQVVQPPEILLNGTPARLSPGARIRDTNNLLVLSGSIMGPKWIVNYIRDGQGMVHEVWLLNATEAQQRPPNDGNERNVRSDNVPSAAPASDSTRSDANTPK